MARLLDEVIRLHETAVNVDREHHPLRSAALQDPEDFVKPLAERRDAGAEGFWKAHLQTNVENRLGSSGPHTVVELYRELEARQEVRLRLRLGLGLGRRADQHPFSRIPGHRT